MKPRTLCDAVSLHFSLKSFGLAFVAALVHYGTSEASCHAHC
jgi:hypothetical protein